MTSQAPLSERLLVEEIQRRVEAEAYCQLLQNQLHMLATEVAAAKAQILALQHLIPYNGPISTECPPPHYTYIEELALSAHECQTNLDNQNEENSSRFVYDPLVQEFQPLEDEHKDRQQTR